MYTAFIEFHACLDACVKLDRRRDEYDGVLDLGNDAGLLSYVPGTPLAWRMAETE